MINDDDDDDDDDESRTNQYYAGARTVETAREFYLSSDSPLLDTRARTTYVHTRNTHTRAHSRIQRRNERNVRRATAVRSYSNDAGTR